MSVELSSLHKEYGKQIAVNDLSFEIKSSEIVGFLGPNGAGKSTTMKMLSCFLPPTSGSATVCGYDIMSDPVEVRRHLGYLPEHNPLYKEMYVHEFLLMCASVHQLDRKKARVSEMIDMTGLVPEQNKRIGQLSKGYRQRVGLAQAMLHDPEVLILDEPTSGLDPNQLVEIRQLIKRIGEKKTVIFSSHIMQEVQALCDRVLIIHQGNLVADCQIEDLPSILREEEVYRVRLAPGTRASMLEQLPGIARLDHVSGGEYRCIFPKGTSSGSSIFTYCAEKGIILDQLYTESTTVEDLFQQLTTSS